MPVTQQPFSNSAFALDHQVSSFLWHSSSRQISFSIAGWFAFVLLGVSLEVMISAQWLLAFGRASQQSGYKWGPPLGSWVTYLWELATTIQLFLCSSFKRTFRTVLTAVVQLGYIQKCMLSFVSSTYKLNDMFGSFFLPLWTARLVLKLTELAIPGLLSWFKSNIWSGLAQFVLFPCVFFQRNGWILNWLASFGYEKVTSLCKADF